MTEKAYKKIISIQKRYVIDKKISMNPLVNYMLDDLLLIVARYDDFLQPGKVFQEHEAKNIDKKNKSTFFIYDTTGVNVLELFSSSIQRWKTSAIYAGSFNKNGIFETFDDFKENVIKKDKIILDSVSADSVYYFAAKDHPMQKKNPRCLIALVYNGTCYVSIFDGEFLPVKLSDGNFNFRIPQSLPDMYALLSYESLNFSFRKSFGPYNSLAGAALAAAVDISIATVQNEKRKKYSDQILAEGRKHDYRYCVIDMDNGDFLYIDKEPGNFTGK